MTVPKYIWAYGFGSNGQGWYIVWPPEEIPPPTEPPTNPGGTYTLNASTKSISGSPGGLSWARFNTGSYQGRITAVKALISWDSLGSMPCAVLGNGSGSYYRSISYDSGYANRSIGHDISAGVGEFNSGAATGYTIDPNTTNTPNVWINNLRLQVTVTT